MDVLRTAVSILAHYDPECQDLSPTASLRKAERLLGQIPVAVAAHWRIAHGMQPIAARADLGHAASFLYLLRGEEATPDAVRALDVSLILYAEHGIQRLDVHGPRRLFDRIGPSFLYCGRHWGI